MLVMVVANEGEYVSKSPTFADSRPPHILDSARAEAMDTLNLILSDDQVLQRSARLDEENSVCITAFILPCARNATAIRFHAAIKDA